MKLRTHIAVVLSLLCMAASALAQDTAADAAIKRVDARREQIVSLWKQIININAPSDQETARADFVMSRLKAAGYREAYRDVRGNLLSAPLQVGKKSVVFSAHMDTVVQAGVQIEVKEETDAQGRWLVAPGAGDDAAGVTALLMMAEVLSEQGYKPKTPLVFVFTVNEEGGGKSEGFRGLIEENKDRIAAIIGVDGSPIDNLGAIADFGTGGFGLTATFLGSGVHTIESYGEPSATRAMSLAIARLYEVKLPRAPVERLSWLNIGMVNAGTVSNAMAKEASFKLDLRSNDAAVGRRLHARAKQIIQQAADEVGVKVEIVPSKYMRDPVRLNTPEQKRLVAMLRRNFRAAGLAPASGKVGSSDYIRGLLNGIPSAGVGVTEIRHMHSAEERALVEPFFKGIQQLLRSAVELTSQ
jgi:tripeptide aminopeptidase